MNYNNVKVIIKVEDLQVINKQTTQNILNCWQMFKRVTQIHQLLLGFPILSARRRSNKLRVRGQTVCGNGCAAQNRHLVGRGHLCARLALFHYDRCKGFNVCGRRMWNCISYELLVCRSPYKAVVRPSNIVSTPV